MTTTHDDERHFVFRPKNSPPDAPSPADPREHPFLHHRRRRRSSLPSKYRPTTSRRTPPRRRRHRGVLSYATRSPPRRRDRNSLGPGCKTRSSSCAGGGWALERRERGRERFGWVSLRKKMTRTCERDVVPAEINVAYDDIGRPRTSPPRPPSARIL